MRSEQTEPFQQDIHHLLIWLCAQPSQQSTAYILEALTHCRVDMELNHDEMAKFVEIVKTKDLVLGKYFPEDEKLKEVYQKFMGYLLRIKNQ